MPASSTGSTRRRTPAAAGPRARRRTRTGRAAARWKSSDGGAGDRRPRDRQPGPRRQRREPAHARASALRGTGRASRTATTTTSAHATTPATQPRDVEVPALGERERRRAEQDRRRETRSNRRMKPGTVSAEADDRAARRSRWRLRRREIRSDGGPTTRARILAALPSRRRDRALPAALAALAFALALLQRPGQASSDTKIDLHVDPVGFLGDVASAWSSTGDLGHVQGGQYGGYLFPMGPFFALGHALGARRRGSSQRLWLGLILALAAWGAVRLMDELPAGRAASRTPSRACSSCSTRTSSSSAPARRSRCSATRRCRGCSSPCAAGSARNPWWWAAAFALIVTASGGGVNAAVTAWMLRRAAAARALRALDRRGDLARVLGVRLAHALVTGARLGLVGRAAARAVALRRRLPALHRAAGDDLEHDEPAGVAAADGLLDLLPRRRLRRRRCGRTSATAASCCSRCRS